VVLGQVPRDRGGASVKTVGGELVAQLEDQFLGC